jgi:hypothetical protein
MYRAIGAILLGFALLLGLGNLAANDPHGHLQSGRGPDQGADSDQGTLIRAAALPAAPDNRSAHKSTKNPGESSDPTDLVLPEPAQGKEALATIGDRLPSVARTNGMSPEQLTNLLLTDDTAWLGRSGNVYFAEEVKPAGVAGTLPTPANAATFPLEQTFSLHSLPGSNRTIFLDFDGFDLNENNSWVDYQYMPSESYSGFTLDSDPTSFSTAELTYIQEVWRIVAEKYSAFDVDVTTEDVGAAAWDRSSLVDQAYGVRVLITNDPLASLSACNDNCSGVAWISQFDAVTSTTDYWQPAWVFSNMTYGSATLTANTAAHEIGHTAGLNHDGKSSQSYYAGHSNWSPIMGGGVNGVQQFSKGEYSGANNTEDDMSKMANNGVATKADDHPNSVNAVEPESATPLMTHSGVITSATDVDVFGITTICPTSLSASANGIGEGSMLDIGLEILDQNSNLLASDDPTSGQNTSYWPYRPTGMDADLTTTLASAGDYFIRIRGVGKGNPLNTGYSNYSSIGTYTLQLQTSCADGGSGDDPPGEDPPNDGPSGEDPPNDGPPDGDPPPGDPDDSTSPRHNSPATRTAAVTGVRAAAGAKGGPRTVRLTWPANRDATRYRVAVSRVGKGKRVVRTNSTTKNRIELRVPPGRYKLRVMAIGVNGASPWSAWSKPVRSR